MPVFANGDNAITPLAADRGRWPWCAPPSRRPAPPTREHDWWSTTSTFVAYEHAIEELLDAGVTIDAIGLQTHMQQGYRGEDGCSRPWTASRGSDCRSR